MPSNIFAKVSRERLEEILDNLHQFISLPIQLIDERGDIVLSFGESPRYCKLLKESVFPQHSCFATHLDAGIRAQDLGEPYIFSCHANLNHIAFPLVDGRKLLGCIIVGPFLMDAPDSTLISGLAEKHRLSPLLSLELYDELSDLPVISPPRVNQLSKLIEHLLSPLFPAEQALMKRTQEKLYQQSKINEAIQHYKEQSDTPTRNFFYTKESELLTKVRAGNLKESKALLNELIGHVLFSEGGQPETVRARAVELTTLLSRVAIDGGASADNVYTLNSRFISLMSREQNMDELCYLLQDVVESFIAATFYQQDQGNAHVRKALQYIAANYPNHITLSDVAAEVNLSTNHLSALFSKIVGMRFRDYLCHVRVEESKRLLRSTDCSMVEIAAAVGFPDQSYFCKAFKKLVGISPGKFRN